MGCQGTSRATADGMVRLLREKSGPERGELSSRLLPSQAGLPAPDLASVAAIFGVWGAAEGRPEPRRDAWTLETMGARSVMRMGDTVIPIGESDARNGPVQSGGGAVETRRYHAPPLFPTEAFRERTGQLTDSAKHSEGRKSRARPDAFPSRGLQARSPHRSHEPSAAIHERSSIRDWLSQEDARHCPVLESTAHRVHS